MLDKAATSRAAVAVKGGRRIEIAEFPIPDIAPDAGLLRVVATGICGAISMKYSDSRQGPRILGHEIVGTIEKIGDIARARWGVRQGDLVALEEYLPCGFCDYCRSGEMRSCLATDTRLPGTVRYGSTSDRRAALAMGWLQPVSSICTRARSCIACRRRSRPTSQPCACRSAMVSNGSLSTVNAGRARRSSCRDRASRVSAASSPQKYRAPKRSSSPA